MSYASEEKSIKKGVAKIIFVLLCIGMVVYIGLTVYEHSHPAVKNTDVPMVISAPVSQKPTSLPNPSAGTGMPDGELASAPCHVINGLPDASCTPGATDSRVTQGTIKETICKSGYTQTVRPPVSVTSKIKTVAMKEYGFSDSPSNYELDHLISLELGGSPDSTKNLFPEPYNIDLNAKKKDLVENYLHKQVCDGAMTLQEAQQEISHDWVTVYHQHIEK